MTGLLTVSNAGARLIKHLTRFSKNGFLYEHFFVKYVEMCTCKSKGSSTFKSALSI